MANRPIIDIDVNDEKFKKFQESFKEFSDSTDKVRESWDKLMDHLGDPLQKVRHLTNEQKRAAASLGGHIHTANRGIQRLTESQGRFTAAMKQSGHAMKYLDGGFKHLKKDVEHIATGVAGIATAAVAAGVALATLQNKMANKALNRQMSARELGMTPAKMKAFEVATRAVLPDPRAFLTKMVNAQQNPMDAVALQRLHIPYSQIQEETPSQLAFTTLKAMHRLYQRQNRSIVGIVDQVSPLEKLGNASQWRLIGNTPLKDINADQRLAQKNAAQLHIGTKAYSADRQLALKESALGALVSTKGMQIAAKLAPAGLKATRIADLAIRKADSAAMTAFANGTQVATRALQGLSAAAAHAANTLFGHQATAGGKLAVLKGQMERAQGTSRYAYAKKAYEDALARRTPQGFAQMVGKMGVTKADAAALAANAQAESGIRASVWSQHHKGFGVFQADAAYRKLYHQQTGKSFQLAGVRQQTAFMLRAFKQQQPQAYARFLAAPNAAAASRIWTTDVEKPLHTRKQAMIRAGLATQYSGKAPTNFQSYVAKVADTMHLTKAQMQALHDQKVYQDFSPPAHGTPAQDLQAMKQAIVEAIKHGMAGAKISNATGAALNITAHAARY